MKNKKGVKEKVGRRDPFDLIVLEREVSGGSRRAELPIGMERERVIKLPA